MGKAQAPALYGKAKGTLTPTPSVALLESAGWSSIDHKHQSQSVMAYEVDLYREVSEIKIHQGAIKPISFLLPPLQWQAV
ncbi:hypothetical protein NC974_17585 [Leptolyngbya sp. SLC-A1]|uniref:hypothetical protein n=1 Tax=Phormidium sp. FACHB-77 TaxID=2692851 RepID=UPI0016835439|nr:hypothetical protein [Phormidium sp. FACHB-77]